MLNSTGFKKYGFIVSLIGEILIITQALLFFYQLALYQFSLEPLGFESFIFLPLIPIPALLLPEILFWIAEKRDMKKFATFSLILLLVFTSITLYIGGGWYFGMSYVIIGCLMRVASTNWDLRRKTALIFITLLVATPFASLLIQSGIQVISARTINFDSMAGPPSYENTLYMTPILERFTWNTTEDNAEIEYLKSKIGPSGDYYKIGFSVSCWYSARLDNASGEWNFNPTDLYYKLNRSVDTNTPILFHMNGGNWGSNSMGNDLLKELWANDSNCQYDQYGRVPATDDTAVLTGLRDRLFSLQQNTDFNKYREIHIKQAGVIISNFSLHYPDLFVGCSLDSEIHLDNAIGGGLYYDYNPAVIQEYQDWLAARYTLEEYNLKFGKAESSFGTIDAPREAVFGNPLWEEWTLFRQHLVQQCVNLQAKWLNESGIPKSKIYSHQVLSKPGAVSARYERCDVLDTAISGYGGIGVTRYNFINPTRFWDIYNINSTNWGIFEWNIWHDRVESDYHLYLLQLKAMYQAGIHVICPNGWFEFANPRLMIRNNPIFIRALVDFANLVKDVPRGTASKAMLNFFDYFYISFMTFDDFQLDFLGVSDFLDFLVGKLWPIGIILASSIISVISIKIIKRRSNQEKEN